MAHLVCDPSAFLDVPMEGEPLPPPPVGGKAYTLALLRNAGFPVPAWFVVLPSALEHSLGVEQLASLMRINDEGAIRQALARLQLSGSILAELDEALLELVPDGETVAVRSSAFDEDGAQLSFAGQYDSFLCVPPAQVARCLLDVWRSAYSERLLAYRRQNGLTLTPQPPAVIVQRMIHADAAGVAFSADPVTGQRGVTVVSAVLGLGTSLVSGETDADTWRVDRDGKMIEARIVAKQTQVVAARDADQGVQSIAVSTNRSSLPALSDAQVMSIVKLTRQLSKYFGTPQDIEWAYADGQLYLLQCRPITSLPHQPDPDGVLNIWDNSNIAESYNGITTPLTFTFARQAYEGVYRQFCRLLGVPASVVEANSHIFKRMLCLVRGTVYYNLLNWYRLIALLPGYKANRGFMEQMMGVKESLPEGLVMGSTAPTWAARMRDRIRFFGGLLAMIRHHFTLNRRIRRFYLRLQNALGPTRPDLTRLRPEEIVAYYREVEGQLLPHWDAPLLNDFFAMIFFGLLGKWSQQWCGDVSLRNDLLAGVSEDNDSGMISAEPARRVAALALAAQGSPDLVRTLCTLGPGDIEAVATTEFSHLLREYLDRFGDRCLEELKLESETLTDNPTPLLRSIGQLAQWSPTDKAEAKLQHPSASIRTMAERRVIEALAGHPIRRAAFWWVLRNARNRIRDRENLRFERTRLFGRVRAIVVELGRQFHALGLLDHSRDIFYLDIAEILSFVEGTVSSTDLRGLAAVRKAEFERYKTMPRPADRFETRGLVYVGHTYQRRATAVPIEQGEELRGLGCCPGIVRGIVRVVLDPRTTQLHTSTRTDREILVARRTDPGWVMLFPAASGLLVEYGSLLSHSAIVAREMGLPAIVSLTGVTSWLQTGDEVEMDGTRGVVRRLARAEKPS